MRFKFLVFFVLAGISFITPDPHGNNPRKIQSSSRVEEQGEVSINTFGGKGDASTDVTPAFNAAIVAASSKSLSVIFPCGTYRFASRPNPIETGIRIRGCGSTGSTVGYGTAFVADYDENSHEEGFLTWNGAYKKGPSGCCAGTGGGIENVTIYNGAGKKGGTALKITGIDDQHRAGFSTISDVLVTSIKASSWDHDLIIDGECCITLHAQGVRDTYINNFWGTQAIAPDQSVLFRGAVQVFWHGGEIAPASAGARCGVTITGGNDITQKSTNIFISDVYVAGNLRISNSRSISFRGLVGGDASIQADASDVILGGIIGGRLLNLSPSATVDTNRMMDIPPEASLTARSIRTGSQQATDLAGSCISKANQCTYLFTGSYSLHPICVANDETTAGAPVKVSYTAAKSVTFRTLGAEDVVDFVCIARN
jgi:hypothetical protein